MTIQGREKQLVWYHFKEKLPDVKPVHAKRDDRPMRAERKIANMSIVSAPRHAPKAPQMIWQKAPEINTDVKFDVANVVAVSLPRAEAPKQFVPPTPQSKKLYAPQIDVPQPPELRAEASAAPAIANSTPARPVRDFRPPAVSRRSVDAPKVDVPAPPELHPGGLPNTVEIAALRESNTLGRPLRAFNPPASRPKAGAPQISDIDPSPALVSGTGAPRSSVLGQVVETSLSKVYRPFSAPPAGGTGARSGAKGGKPGAAVPVMPSPPPDDAAGTDSNGLNLVVVGLNPGSELAGLPPVSRPAEFSAGPKLNPNGGAGDGNGAAALSVPDLTIRSPRNGGIDTRSTIMARNTPPNRPPGFAAGAGNGTDDALRQAARYVTVDDIGHPSATRVTSAPGGLFDGRAIYMMAIQMPNITSYVGSWLMWYSERTSRPVSTAVITPPGVHRKVDPKYVASAVSDRVEGVVRLAAILQKDGSISSIELVRGIDERLDRTAQEALAKWQFSPAMRNGTPIDVDILVEIPFRLAPRAER